MSSQLSMTPGFLDDVMNGTADISIVRPGWGLIPYDAMRIHRTESGLCVDFMRKNKAIAGFDNVEIGVGSALTLTDLQGVLEARFTDAGSTE